MSAPAPRGTAALVRLRLGGLVFLLVIVGLVGLSIALYQKAFTPVVMVTLKADRIGNQLSAPADVKVRGLIVGTVRDVRSTGDGADISLALQPDKVKLIPKDVSARLLPKTLFGEKFVALVLPEGDTAGPIGEGDEIPQDRSETALETEKVLDDLLPLLQTLKPEQLSTTLNAVADAVRGRGDRIGENLVAVDAYFKRLNPEIPGIQENVRRLAALAEDYDDAAPDFLATLDNFSAIGRNLVDQQDELGTFLTSTTTSVDVFDDVLKENERRLVTLAEDSLPSLMLYARYSPEFPCLAKGLNAYQPIVQDTFGVLQPGLHITLELTQDQNGYQPGDEPRNRDTQGPYCDGLPRPKIAGPGRGVQGRLPRHRARRHPRVERRRGRPGSDRQGRLLRPGPLAGRPLLAARDPQGRRGPGAGRPRGRGAGPGGDAVRARGPWDDCGARVKTSAALVKLIIFMVVTSLLTFVLAATIGSFTFGGQTKYRAAFSDVTGLLPGNEVRISGVKVGKVDKIELADDSKTATVDFSLSEGRQMAASTILRLRYRNLVGERYLAITEGPGTADPLKEGSLLPLAQTRNALDLTVLFNGFRPLFQALDPATVNKVSFELVQVLQGEGGTVESLMQRTASLTNTLADRDAVIGRVITNLGTVLETIDERDDQLNQLVTQLQRLSAGFAQDRAAIGESLAGINDLTGATTGLLQDVRGPLKRRHRAAGRAGRHAERRQGGRRRDPQAAAGQARPHHRDGDLRVLVQLLPVRRGRTPRPAGGRDRHPAARQHGSALPGPWSEEQLMRPFREQNKTIIGLIGIAVILGLLGAAFTLDRFIGGEEYAAEFTEAAGLRPNDEVRVAGVKVGKVIATDLAGDRVKVKMRVKGAKLGRATRADIRIKTVLGRKFLSLSPDGPGEMKAGDVIPLDRTTSPYDITDAFQGLATTVEDIDSQQLARSFTTLADTFRDTPDEVRASLEGLSRLSRTIASRDAELKRLLDRSRGVTEVLAARDEDLVKILSDTSLVLDEVRKRRQVIDQLLTSTTALSEQLIALTRENRATLAPALARLRGVVTVLRNNQANLDKALVRLPVFTRLFANNLGNGRWFDTLVQNFTNPQGFAPGTFGDGKPRPTSQNGSTG